MYYDVNDDLLQAAVIYHAGLDEAIACAAGALSDAGIGLTCARGCSWCCRLPVRATPPEAMLAAAYLSGRLSTGETAALKMRVEAWLDWSRRELSRPEVWGFGRPAAPFYETPTCPFLTDDLCSIYPVRPMGCRVHSSTAQPETCQSSTGADLPPEVLEAVKPLCMEYRRGIEAQGISFDKAVDYLPALVLRLL